LFTTTLAAFQVLLWRYSGQEDICVGTPLAGRSQPQTQGLIGLLVNTLLLRSQLQAHLPFSQLLQQLQATTLQAYQHQLLPFEKLVEKLADQRELNRSPLFQVMFTLLQADQSYQQAGQGYEQADQSYAGQGQADQGQGASGPEPGAGRLAQ
jgi:non-ribosomal peptide synthetase component F